jgi:hypothetical protein
VWWNDDLRDCTSVFTTKRAVEIALTKMLSSSLFINDINPLGEKNHALSTFFVFYTDTGN